MLTLFQVVLLGIVEGFTEFLPISSTAHLILAADLLGIAQSDFIKTFEIAIQSGAIAAVIFLYWRKFLDPEVLKKITMAFIPTAVIGFILYKIVKTFLLGNTSVVLWSLALGGIALIAFEYIAGNKKSPAAGDRERENITYQQAFSVGVFQAIAMIPGVSRSGATIIGGMAVGLSRETITEFSFLLAVPTMLAATGFDLIKSAPVISLTQLHVLVIGAATSFIMALIGIRFFLGYIRKHSFTAFGIYRIALVFAFAAFWLR